MKREVKAGVNFFKRLVVARGKLDAAKVQLFAEKLQQLLCDKYDGHWYPDCPSKGQAFRCIRINSGIPNDEVLLKACEESELTPSDLCLPQEVTVWIDPLEVCGRSRENSYPFSIASFTDNDKEEEDSMNKEQEDSPVVSTNHDTSDYHSATSSDCGSAVSSDTEEEAKDGETESAQEKKAPVKKQPQKDDTVKITMVPRIRKRHGGGSNRVKYGRNLVPMSVQYFCQPVPVWSHCMNGAPVFLTTVVAPPPPPPPPPHQVFVHYLSQPPPLLQPLPHFIVPRAAPQSWEPVNDEMAGLRPSAEPV